MSGDVGGGQPGHGLSPKFCFVPENYDLIWLVLYEPMVTAPNCFPVGSTVVPYVR